MHFQPGMPKLVRCEWPDLDLVASERDAQAPRFRDVVDELPFTYGG